MNNQPIENPPASDPAFPCDWKDFQSTTGDQVTREQYFGLTMRDYFAAKAMAALIVSRPPEVDGMGYIFPSEWRPIVSGAFKISDEMLIERARKEAQ